MFIHGSTLNDLNQLNETFSIDNVNFLIHDGKNSLKLFTSFMYTKEKCRQSQFKMINQFNIANMKWKRQTFEFQKYRNFFGCNVTAGVSQQGLKDFHIFTPLLDEILTHLNFTLDVKVIENPNSTEIDFFIDHSNVIVNQIIYFKHIELLFFVPPGDSYTQFEKLFLPFEYEVWLAIIGTLIIGLVTIQIINRLSKEVRNFVYGRNISTPNINLASIFLNGGQFKIPGRNFSRFLLMLFIIWCLIIRTCYQSMLFEFLQADKRKSPVKSLDEALDKNLTLFAEVSCPNTTNSESEYYYMFRARQ